MFNIVALASGNGTNFRCVVNAIKDGSLSGMRIIGLITDRPGTGASDFARDEGIPVFELDYSMFQDRNAYNAELKRTVASLSPDLILALGYMRIMDENFVESYPRKIINIHPSLLPSFPGMNAQKKALDYGVKVTGVTVHYVDTGVDTGPIILQSPVSIPEGIDESGLSELIRKEEHRTIVEAVRLHCSGSLRMDGRRVIRRE